MAQVYVSLGSNVEREQRIRQGIALLRQQFGQLRISPVYESAAIGFEGDEFYNLVVGFETALQPKELVALLRHIEQSCGRNRGLLKFAPRTLDIDILLYGDVILENENIRIPHPDITRFAYVLRPLAELCPDCVYPPNNKSIQQLWAEFPAQQQLLTPIKMHFE